MPWSKLDDGFHEHAKICAMSDKAFRLYVCSITYSSRHHLYGRLKRIHVQVLFKLTGASQDHDDELVAIHGWDAAGEDRVIHGFEDYNSGEEIARKRAEAGRLGGLRSGEVRSNEANAKQMLPENEANVEANAKQKDSRPDPTRSRPTEVCVSQQAVVHSEDCEVADRYPTPQQMAEWRARLKALDPSRMPDEIEYAIQSVCEIAEKEPIRSPIPLLVRCIENYRRDRTRKNGAPPTGYTDQINQRVIAKARAEGRLK